jgi:hypothetical protein
LAPVVHGMGFAGSRAWNEDAGLCPRKERGSDPMPNICSVLLDLFYPIGGGLSSPSVRGLRVRFGGKLPRRELRQCNFSSGRIRSQSAFVIPARSLRRRKRGAGTHDLDPRFRGGDVITGAPVQDSHRNRYSTSAKQMIHLGGRTCSSTGRC